MPVNIEAALREGYQRTVARNGLMFVGILFVVGVLNGLFAASVVRGMLPPEATGSIGTMPNAPSLGLSPAVAGLLSLILGVASIVITVGEIRTFVSEETEHIPTEHFTRNIILAAVNLIVGGIVFGILVAIGFVLLVVPGLFLLVSLFFWNVYVIVEDRNFVDGMQRSWGLTRGHRWRLFAIGIAVAIIAAVINILFGLPSAVLPRSIGFLVTQLGAALVSVYITATLARTFVQLESIDAEAASDAMADEAATS